MDWKETVPFGWASTRWHFMGAFFRLKGAEFWKLTEETFSAWNTDNVPRLGASLAYYTALSLAPLIIVVLAVAGLAFGQEAVRGELVDQIRGTVGQRGAQAIQDLIASSRGKTSGIVATGLGLVTLFFGATSSIVELTDALNTIWHVPLNPAASGITSLFRLLKERVMSFVMVLGIGFLLLVSLVISAGVAIAGSLFHSFLPFSEAIMHLITAGASFLVITALFAALYKFLPSVHLDWEDVVIGAVVTSVLFTLGKMLLGIYLGKSTMANAYGAAGSFIIVLVWVYYSAQIFYIGAEFTRIYSHRFGSRRTLPLPAGVQLADSSAVHGTAR